MPKKKRREDKSRVEPEADEPFNSAFAGLAALRPSRAAETPPIAEESAEPNVPEPPPSAEPDGPDLGRGKIVVRKEKKGRGGKAVTRVDGLEATPEALSTLARRLAKELGCGAKVEDGSILAQGDQSERVAGWLRAQGARRVVLGDFRTSKG